ncbi:hypothetical protein [Microvirga sp. VF16]|uniref:hypothetical protein n=1 Tax=Microvirga sp. VF16 TaxID=2807101 RepID=UPI00193E7F0A|nr:hypothetical protein [Microvirga sp. VF16]QRM34889.1 hypothetical protein JO965_42275 [Microvirga sp. VF16]
MHAYTRPLVRRRPNAAERTAQVILLGLVLIGIAAMVAIVICSVFEPHIIVAFLVVALLFLVFRIETRPQHLPKGAFYPSRSLGHR